MQHAFGNGLATAAHPASATAALALSTDDDDDDDDDRVNYVWLLKSDTTHRRSFDARQSPIAAAHDSESLRPLTWSKAWWSARAERSDVYVCM